jgi:hypothetical protein
MREKTVIAMFDTFDAAKSAVNDAIKAGASPGRISMLANDSTGNHPSLMTNPAYAREEFDADSDKQSGVITGAEIGLGLGGLLGFLTHAAAVPDMGIWVAVGGGAALGAVIGGVIGARNDHGISAEDATLFDEGIKRGGTLVTVVTAEIEAVKLEQIFRKRGAISIAGREPGWTAEGWVTFDPGEGLLSGAHAA